MAVVTYLTGSDASFSIIRMRHYVITYSGITDPTVEESEALVATIGREKIVDSSPGMFLVAGDFAELKRAVGQHRDWQISPSVRVKVNPHRKELKPPK